MKNIRDLINTSELTQTEKEAKRAVKKSSKHFWKQHNINHRTKISLNQI